MSGPEGDPPTSASDSGTTEENHYDMDSDPNALDNPQSDVEEVFEDPIVVPEAETPHYGNQENTPNAFEVAFNQAEQEKNEKLNSMSDEDRELADLLERQEEDEAFDKKRAEIQHQLNNEDTENLLNEHSEEISEQSEIANAVDAKIKEEQEKIQTEENTIPSETSGENDHFESTKASFDELTDRINKAETDGNESLMITLQEQKYNLAQKAKELTNFRTPELDAYIKEYEDWNTPKRRGEEQNSLHNAGIDLKEMSAKAAEEPQEEAPPVLEEPTKEPPKEPTSDPYHEPIDEVPAVLPSDSIRENPEGDAADLQEMLEEEHGNPVLDTKEAQKDSNPAKYGPNEEPTQPVIEGEVVDSIPEDAIPVGEAAPETLNDKELTVRKFEQYGVSIEEMNATVEGFSDLSDGQKLLVAENFEQLALGAIGKEQAAKFDELQQETQRKGVTGTEGAVASRLKAARNGAQMIWQSFRRTHHLNEFGKQALEEQQQNGLEAHRDILETLTKSTENGPGIEYKNGVAEIQYATGFNNLDATQQESVDSFNAIANEFTRVPLEWQYAKEGSTERKAYDEAKTQFETAKNEVLAIKQSQVGADNEAQLLQFAAQMKHGVEMNQLFNSYPDAEARLATIRDGETWAAAMQSQIKERGLLITTGFVTRHALTGLVGLASIPAAMASGGVVGAIRGRMQGYKDVNERDFLARHGEDKEGMAEKDLNSSENMANKFDLLFERINQATTEEDRNKLIDQGMRRASVAAQKMKDGTLNFGSGAESIANMSRLMDSLGEIHALDAMYDNLEGSNEDPRAERFQRLFDKIQEASNEAISEQDEAHIKAAMKEGAISGLKFGAIGALITDVVKAGVSTPAAIGEAVEQYQTSPEEVVETAVESPTAAENAEVVEAANETKEIPTAIEAVESARTVEVQSGDTVWALVKAGLGPDATDTDVANRINALRNLSQEELYDRGFRADRNGEINVDHIEPGQHLDISEKGGGGGTQPEQVVPITTEQDESPETEKQTPPSEEHVLDLKNDEATVETEPQSTVQMSPIIGDLDDFVDSEGVERKLVSPERLAELDAKAEARKDWLQNEMAEIRAQNDPESPTYKRARSIAESRWRHEQIMIIRQELAGDAEGEVKIPPQLYKERILEAENPNMFRYESIDEITPKLEETTRDPEPYTAPEEIRTRDPEPYTAPEEVRTRDPEPYTAPERVVDISSVAAELSERRMTSEEFATYEKQYGESITNQMKEIYVDRDERGGVQKRVVRGHGPLNDVLDRALRGGINSVTGANIENNMRAWEFDKTIPVDEMLRNNNIALQESQGRFGKPDSFDYQNRSQLQAVLREMSQDMKPFEGETIWEYMIRHEAFEQDALSKIQVT